MKIDASKINLNGYVNIVGDLTSSSNFGHPLSSRRLSINSGKLQLYNYAEVLIGEIYGGKRNYNDSSTNDGLVIKAIKGGLRLFFEKDDAISLYYARLNMKEAMIRTKESAYLLAGESGIKINGKSLSIYSDNTTIDFGNDWKMGVTADGTQFFIRRRETRWNFDWNTDKMFVTTDEEYYDF